MSVPEVLARIEHSVRPLIASLPPSLAIRVFSNGRAAFAKRFGAQRVVADRTSQLDPSLAVTLWGLHFRVPIMNAAGMFKQGEGYAVVANQGAGGYVVGTTTATPRVGNTKAGVRWPAASYARSHAASNWLGLPNEGHAVVARRLAAMPRNAGCPVGASVSADPGAEETMALHGLAEGMHAYIDAKVDYLELNESCPNVPGHHDGPQIDDGLIRRLEYVAQHVLRGRRRPCPVVVKFSTDTNPEQIADLVDVVVTLGFDGIILGNTSTNYALRRTVLDDADRRLYDHFTQTFGGGVSGRPLAADSLSLCMRAMQEVQRLQPAQEFHVIRCGGVEDWADIRASQEHGILLHQWYTGYFASFAQHGHDVYCRLFSDELTLSSKAR